MKKYFLSLVAMAAAMLFATSCQESLVEPQVGGPTTFTVQVPDAMGTKSLGSKDNVNQLFVAVYADASVTNASPIYRTVATVSNGKATVKLNLIQDQFYDVIFWAQVGDNYVSSEKDANDNFTFDLVNIPMNKNYHNTDAGAAFFYYWNDFKPTGTSQPVTLRRPFAQLNLGTTSASLETNAGNFQLVSSKIEVKGIADNFNTVSGFGTVTEANKDKVYTFIAVEDSQVSRSLPSDPTIEVADVEYKYVSMDYLPIVGDDQALITVDATITLNNSQSINHKFTNVPVRENYRTNIVGNLISSTTDFNVVVDDKFEEDYSKTDDIISNDYYVVDNVGQAESKFGAGETHIAINHIKNGESLDIPNNSQETLYLQLPDVNAEFTVNVLHQEVKKLYITVPNTDESNVGLDLIVYAPNSTVEIKDSQLNTINGTTAQNTLILNGVTVNAVVVEQGNVVVENDSAVGGIAPGEDVVDASTITIYVDDSSADDTAVDDRFTLIEEDDDIKFITSAAKLQQLADKVNNDGANFADQTITLLADIDLNNVEWTPIGKSSNPFNGTFDGNNHTISNLVVEGGSESNQGLFGCTTDGEIKNLIVNNAKVSGRLNVGVVAGTPYTSKYTNIKVTGHVEVNGMAYVGGVAGKNAYANWTDITVEVDETSLVYANSVEENGTAYRTYVGGVVGFNGEGGHSFTNITSNIDVKGSTCDVGGLFGIAHYNNKFINCSSSGDVEIYAAEDIDSAEQIGGIAGVWHNADGTTVTFTNCSFTGKLLKTNVEGVDLSDNKITGKAYNEEGNGKLIIDGVSTTLFNSLEELNAAIEKGYNVIVTNNIAVAKNDVGSNGYGATGITQLNGGVIDGNGNNISVNAWGTWDSAINTTGGTIKNLNVTGGMRGIFVNHNSDNRAKVILENVTIDGTVYTISCDQGTNNGLEAYNSTFNGWTSYAATIGNVKFVGCSFGEGQGYSFCRPYAPTEFVNCAFEAGYVLDPRAAVTFENCTIGDVALTAENLATLVTSNIANATVK